MSETVHPDLDLGAKTFKSLVWDNSLKIGLGLLFANAPYLNLPIVRNIVTSIATMASNWLFWTMKLCVDLSAVPIINAQLKSRYDEDYAALKLIAIKQGIDSPEFTKAREEASNAFADFIRFSATRSRK